MDIYNYYDSIAPSYHELHGEEQRLKYEYINSLVPIIGKVLDVGCGDAQLSSLFKVDYYGVEPSRNLIEKSKFKDFFDINKIQLVTAENMVLSDMFDLIISVTVAHHFSDANKVFMNCKEHLKKEGVLIVSLLKTSKRNSEIKQLLENLFSVTIHDQGKDFIYICKDKV